MSDSNQKLEVSVWRGDENSGRFETYSVPARDNQTILDVVSWIQQNAAGDLSYRYACRVGMCGSCAMMVNGTPRWTCRTHVKKVLKGGRLELAPLRNLPVIRDLVADMDPFFEKWVQAGGAHVPTRNRHDPIVALDPGTTERKAADAAIECINCSVCYAACDTVSVNPGYLGPAALQRAWTILNDPKHGDKQGVLDAVSAAGGCHTCHSMGSSMREMHVDLECFAGCRFGARPETRATMHVSCFGRLLGV